MLSHLRGDWRPGLEVQGLLRSLPSSVPRSGDLRPGGELQVPAVPDGEAPVPGVSPGEGGGGDPEVLSVRVWEVLPPLLSLPVHHLAPGQDQ